MSFFYAMLEDNSTLECNSGVGDYDLAAILFDCRNADLVWLIFVGDEQGDDVPVLLVASAFDLVFESFQYLIVGLQLVHIVGGEHQLRFQVWDHVEHFLRT